MHKSITTTLAAAALALLPAASKAMDDLHNPTFGYQVCQSVGDDAYIMANNRDLGRPIITERSAAALLSMSKGPWGEVGAKVAMLEWDISFRVDRDPSVSKYEWRQIGRQMCREQILAGPIWQKLAR